MDTNRHEGFRGEAALECVGTPQDGFAVANLTPLSGARLLVVKFWCRLAYLADK
jgi:hypothetical protein